ncbi:hypothetical protein ACVPOS_09775 [Staphylococcus aureus]
MEKEILQTMQVGVGPQQREIGSTNSNRQCKLAGPQHREIGSPISTDNASWGGAQHRSWRKVGVQKCASWPQHRSWRKVSIQKCASWRGPNIEAGAKSAYKNVQVGVGHG